MKPITLPIAELKSAVTGFGKIVPSRPSLPVLGQLRLERAKDGTVAITATDLDAFVTVRFATDTKHDPITFLVPQAELSQTIKSCGRQDTLLIEFTSPQALQIKHLVGSQLIEQSFATLPVDEFPAVPSVDGLLTPIADQVRTAMLQALDCASIDETRLILNGAYLDVSVPKCHHVVGTNGNHLFSSNSFTLPLKDSLIVPAHRFLEWKTFCADGPWVIRVAKPKKDEVPQFEIRSDRWSFIANAREGNFPNWRQVVPTPASFQTEIQIEPQAVDEIVALIQRLPFHDKINLGVGLEVKKGQVEMLARADREAPWSRFSIPEAKVHGHNVRIHLNRQLLAKALRFGLCKIDIIDSLSPLKFSEGGRQMIVMPLRPEAAPSTSSAARKPAPPAASQPQPPPPAEQPEKTTMPRTASNNGNGHQHAAKTKPALECAMEQIETIKGSYREAIRGLNELGETLKQVHREHKTVQSVRTTLERLQTVRI